MSKVNYRIHTDAIKENLIPKVLSIKEVNMVYANEADLLNIALFGITAKEWRNSNPKRTGNIRDDASLEQLVILSNMESINALLLEQNLSQTDRLVTLNNVAINQMKSLLQNKSIRKIENNN